MKFNTMCKFARHLLSAILVDSRSGGLQMLRKTGSTELKNPVSSVRFLKI